MNIRMHLDIQADSPDEAANLMGRLASAFGGTPVAVTSSASTTSTPETTTGGDADKGNQEDRPVASRKTYCHDKANKRLFTLEKGDTLPSEESGVETVSKGTYEKLEAKYAPDEEQEELGDDEPELTLDDVKSALKKLATEKSPADAKKIVTDAGVKQVSELEPDQYAAVVAAATSALAGGGDDDLDLD